MLAPEKEERKRNVNLRNAHTHIRLEGKVAANQYIDKNNDDTDQWCVKFSYKEPPINQTPERKPRHSKECVQFFPEK